MLGKGNQLVRRIRILRRDRSQRTRQGVFLAEGLHLCQEALASGADLELAVYSDRLHASAEGSDLLERLRVSGVELHQTSDRILGSMQDARSPQPVLGIVRAWKVEFESLLERPGHDPLVVVAHEIQDPGNLGTILRTADAAGASGLVATGRSTDLHHPRTVRATMGSVFRLPAMHHGDLNGLISRFRDRGIRQFAAQPAGGRDPDRLDWTGAVALYLGPERGGLPAGAVMDEVLSIGMEPGVDSLSVGAAAAVILFAARKVRSGAG